MTEVIHPMTVHFIETPPEKSRGDKKRKSRRYTPTKPAGKTRFVIVSDTHSVPGWHHDLPEADVFIHAGDLTRAGTKAQLDRVFEEIKALPYECKLVIAGNHDLGLDPVFVHRHAKQLADYKVGISTSNLAGMRRRWKSREATASGIIFLEHEAYRITVNDQHFNVFGSPYTPDFLDWAFMYPLKEDLWTSQEKSTPGRPGGGIPDDVDILITHGPPAGIMDKVKNVGPVGCPFLLDRLQQVQPLIHIFGHIHEGAEIGIEKHKFGGRRETTCINASILDEAYSLAYQPMVIDL